MKGRFGSLWGKWKYQENTSLCKWVASAQLLQTSLSRAYCGLAPSGFVNSSLNTKWVILGLWLSGNSRIPAMIPRSLNSGQLFCHFACKILEMQGPIVCFPTSQVGVSLFSTWLHSLSHSPQAITEDENLACSNAIMEVINKYWRSATNKEINKEHKRNSIG